ncbi:MAG TPA: hypothetical protein EYP14_03675, partial [Planctomycetaceae bacterium]|nr:hypothetical protein [Planctomycetaceae bacterium]
MSGQEPTRRLFLEAAAGSLAGVLSSVHRAAAQRPDRPLGKGDIPASPAPADIPVSLKPTGADLGRLYADVERLAHLHEFEYSFLGGRFRD